MTHGRQGFIDGYLEKTAWTPFGNASKGVTAGTQAAGEQKPITGQIPIPSGQPAAADEPSTWSRVKEVGSIIMRDPSPRSLITNPIMGNAGNIMSLPNDDPRKVKFLADPKNAWTANEYNRRVREGFIGWTQYPGNLKTLAGDIWQKYKKPIAFGGAALLGMAALPFMYSAMNRNKQVPQQTVVNPGGRQPEAWESQTPFRMGDQQRQAMQWQQMQNYQAALAKSQTQPGTPA